MIPTTEAIFCHIRTAKLLDPKSHHVVTSWCGVGCGAADKVYRLETERNLDGEKPVRQRLYKWYAKMPHGKFHSDYHFTR